MKRADTGAPLYSWRIYSWVDYK